MLIWIGIGLFIWACGDLIAALAAFAWATVASLFLVGSNIKDRFDDPNRVRNVNARGRVANGGTLLVSRDKFDFDND